MPIFYMSIFFPKKKGERHALSKQNATVQSDDCGGTEKAYPCRVERKKRQKEFGQCGKDGGEKKNRQCVLSDEQ